MSSDIMTSDIADQMVCREANIDDLDELVRIRMDYLRTEFTMDSIEEERLSESIRAYLTEAINKTFFAYCAFADESIVSSVFLSISVRPPNPRYSNGMSGYISNVYTNPIYRRRGIAQDLMEQTIRKAEIIGLCSLELIASDMGRKLYEKIGFTDNNKNMRLMLSTKCQANLSPIQFK